MRNSLGLSPGKTGATLAGFSGGHQVPKRLKNFGREKPRGLPSEDQDCAYRRSSEIFFHLPPGFFVNRSCNQLPFLQ
jgi:hypothetical protein